MTIKALAPELRAESFGVLVLAFSKACITGKPSESLTALTLSLSDSRPSKLLSELRPINERDPLKPRPGILPPDSRPGKRLSDT